jgi:mycofactocin system creatininase family protein
VSRSGWLADLTWPQVASAAQRGAILAVPVGATEQHGPHLPLSTDTDLAIALCERLAAQRETVLIAPAVPYGSSGEHAGFAGTLSIGQDVTEAVLVELGRSASATFTQLLLVSAHGGNVEPVTRAVARLRTEGRDVHVYAPRWNGHPHAGRPETSMLLAVDASRVQMERAETGDQRPLDEILPALRDGGVAAVSANGVLGDPIGASASEGAALLDALTLDLLAEFDSWASSARAGAL